MVQQSQSQSQSQKLSNEVLESTLRTKVLAERKLTLEIIELLQEVDRRKLYLQRGFRSLIEYCVKELKYSESAAFRRISAMRVVREVPETKIAIENGSLNLTNVAKAQNFFRLQEKSNNPNNLAFVTVKNQEENSSRNSEAANYSLPLARENKINILKKLENKSFRETERFLLELQPKPVPKERSRQLTPEVRQVTLVMSESLILKLEKLKDLLSHKNTTERYADLIEAIADMAIEKLEKNLFKTVESADLRAQRKAKPTLVARSDAAQPSRYIPAHVKRQVWQKSKGRCCYQDPISGRKCSATRYLEFDHIKPFIRGGANTAENLQLLCGGHNRWKSDF